MRAISSEEDDARIWRSYAERLRANLLTPRVSSRAWPGKSIAKDSA